MAFDRMGLTDGQNALLDACGAVGGDGWLRLKGGVYLLDDALVLVGHGAIEAGMPDGPNSAAAFKLLVTL